MSGVFTTQVPLSGKAGICVIYFWLFTQMLRLGLSTGILGNWELKKPHFL